jgi:hypothetical protein
MVPVTRFSRESLYTPSRCTRYGCRGVLEYGDTVLFGRTSAGEFDQADVVLAEQGKNVVLDKPSGGAPLVSGLGDYLQLNPRCLWCSTHVMS